MSYYISHFRNHCWRRFSRRASAIVKNGAIIYEGLVDLNNGSMLDWHLVEGRQPGIFFEEIFGITGIVLSNQSFRDGLTARGLENIELVNCSPLTVGDFGIPGEQGQRLMKVSCFDMNRTRNTFAKPISGPYTILLGIGTRGRHFKIL